MLALSTSWRSVGSVAVEEMIAAFRALDIAGIELSYRISEDFYQKLREPLKHSDLKVVSIHNFFPTPPVKKGLKGGGDLFQLSSQVDEERQRAITYTIKTIGHAAEMGAGAVVLHCGFVEMNHEVKVLYQYFNSNRLDSEEAQIFIQNKL